MHIAKIMTYTLTQISQDEKLTIIFHCYMESNFFEVLSHL